MNTALWWLLQNSIAAAVLAAAIAPCCRLLRSRPALQHALWLVVLVKFATPPIVVWPWQARPLVEPLAAGIFTLGGASSGAPSRDAAPAFECGTALQSGTVSLADGREIAGGAGGALSEPGSSREKLALLAARLRGPGSREEPDAGASGDAADAVLPLAGNGRPVDANPALPETPPPGGGGAPAGAAPPDEPAAGGLSLEQLAAAAFSAWAAGGLALACFQGRRILQLRSLLRRARRAPAHLEGEVRSMALALGARPVPALVAPGIDSPFIACLGAPRLLWPESLAGPADVSRCRCIIAHELAHLQRGDHLVAWLELAAGLVWWWNPVFRMARRRLREAAEIACDARALAALPENRRQYAETFLELSSARPMPAPALGASSGGGRIFQRRLAMMLSMRVRPRMSSYSCLAAGLLALAALPGWSLGQGALPAGSPDGGSLAKPGAPEAGEAKTPSPGQGDAATLDSRVRNLEAKLDAILRELKDLRTAGSAGGSSAGFGAGAGGSSGGSSGGGAVGNGGGGGGGFGGGDRTIKPAPSGGKRKPSIAGAGGKNIFGESGAGGTQKPAKPLEAKLPGGESSRVIERLDHDGRSYLLARLDACCFVMAMETDTQGVLWTSQLANDSLLTSPASQWALLGLTAQKASETVLLKVQAKVDGAALLFIIDAATGKIIEQKALGAGGTGDPSNPNDPSPSRGGSNFGRTEADPFSDDQPAPRGRSTASRLGGAAPAELAPIGGLQQIDLIHLGTSCIDARGALLLATNQIQTVRQQVDQKLATQDALDTAYIQLETAKQKMELLNAIAAAARDAAEEELQAAQTQEKRMRDLRDKGFLSQSEADRAEDRLVQLRARLRVLHSIAGKDAGGAGIRK